MIEVLISICVKAAAASMVGEVKKQIIEVPIKVAEEIWESWNEGSHLDLEKVNRWVGLVENTSDVLEATKAVVQSLGSKDTIELSLDAFEFVGAAISTSNNLADILREPPETVAPESGWFVPAESLSMEPEPHRSITRRVPKKRNVNHPKRKNIPAPQLTIVRLRKPKYK